MRYLLIYIILFFAVGSAGAQSGLIRKAQKRLEKAEYEQVESLISKSLEKDSLYPAAFYMQSVLFFTPEYPQFQLDSAYRYILFTREVYDTLDVKEKGRHVKLGVDSISIDSLKRGIDRVAFFRANEGDEEKDYIFYLNNFPTSAYVQKAINLRNERGYQLAVRINTYQSYKTFMEKYPDAQQRKDAEKRYEKLYFDKSTADNKLKSYEQFLKTHPTTPYRKEAESRIYEVLTAKHDVNGYLTFLQRYPQSYLVERATSFMFHAAIGNRSVDEIPDRYLTDSLRNSIYNPESFLIPYLSNRKYGFIDEKGEVVSEAINPSISEDLICGGIVDDFYVAVDKLIARNGAVIYKGSFDMADDLGFGVIKLTIDDRVNFIHKSGCALLEGDYEDGKMIHGQFMAVKKNSKWALYSLSGLPITRFNFDNIFSLGRFILFEEDDQFDMAKAEQLAATLDENTLTLRMIFDDYELMNDSVLWLQSSYGEAIYDNDLNELIPYNEHVIDFLDKRYTTTAQNKFQVYDSLFQPIIQFEYDLLEKNDQWLIYKKDTSWHLLNITTLEEQSQDYDSIALLGSQFVVGYNQMDIEILTRGEKILKDGEEGTFSLISNPNSTQYLLFNPVNKRKMPTLYNSYGQKIFESKVENFVAIGDELLAFTEDGKRGMINSSGEYILRPRYDAIAANKENMVSVLRNRKFGLYDEVNEVFIPTNYDKNLRKYNNQYYIAESEGRKVVIDHDNEQLSNDSFEEVVFWNDTSALVKNDFLWYLYDLNSGTLSEQGIKSISFIRESSEELVAVILVDNSYGVWSSTRGEVIAPTFNDIVNVGTENNHVYFTEKHIEEAEFYVVIYYNENGELIFKSATEAEDYGMIYCDN